MAYRNKTYVCFDADNDFDYYDKMKEWKADDNIAFNFYDAHDLNNIREDSQETTIKKKLKERFKDTKLLVVLVGDVTKNLYKYVRWEIETALNMEIPIITVNIINNNTQISENFPPILRDKLVVNVQFDQRILQYSIDNWINEHKKLFKQGTLNNRVWKEHIYKSIGMSF